MQGKIVRIHLENEFDLCVQVLYIWVRESFRNIDPSRKQNTDQYPKTQSTHDIATQRSVLTTPLNGRKNFIL